ncbi:MAG: hypothetical protein JWP12_500 [Bacteroidetes bacterium]|nr:hypothetical protein [Bacteroidota bacterium]
MQPIIEIINQLNTLESKLSASDENARSFNRIKQALSEMGYSYSSPVNEDYKDTRTDVDATIIGESTKNLVITKVIKPIIIQDSKIVQRAIVIVESK